VNMYTATGNTISNAGRIAICRGALSHTDLRSGLSSLSYPLIILASSAGALVNPSHSKCVCWPLRVLWRIALAPVPTPRPLTHSHTLHSVQALRCHTHTHRCPVAVIVRAVHVRFASTAFQLPAYRGGGLLCL
jgi:hypothetical protein